MILFKYFLEEEEKRTHIHKTRKYFQTQKLVSVFSFVVSLHKAGTFLELECIRPYTHYCSVAQQRQQELRVVCVFLHGDVFQIASD